MKTTKIIFLLFICLSIKATAEQPAWELVSMNPPRGLIYSWDTSSNGSVFLTGGNIIYSTNNGNSWNWTGGDNNWRSIAYKNILITSKKLPEYSSPLNIFKSTDNGGTWKECTGEWKLGSTWLAKYNNFLYALVQDLNWQYHFYSSIDEGETWIKKSSLNDSITWGFVFISVYNNLVITAGRALQTNGSNIKLSLDTGKTWENLVFPYFEIFNIEIVSDKEIYCYGTGNGIWLSEDTCKTWKVKYLNDKRGDNFLILNNRSHIVAYVPREGIYYSNDSGKTWNLSDEFKNYPSGINFGALFKNGDYIYTVPAYLAPYRSSDYGKTWEEVSNGFSAAAPYDFIINPYGEMFISHFGIFKSTNEGRKFNFQGMRDFSFETMAYNSKGYIYACMANYNFAGNNGIYRSKDGGKTWDFHYLANTDVSAIVIDEIDYIYITKLTGGVYRSTDDGETWKEVFTPGGSLGVNDEGHIFNFMNNFIYRSLDKGDSWEEVGAGEFDPTGDIPHGRIIFNNKTKTAAYYGLVTIDNGRSWWNQEDYGYGFGNTNNKYFAVDSSYNWIVAYKGGILRSTENGKSWQRMDTSGLKHSEYCRPAVSPDGHIYVFGATGGLYRSRDKFVSVVDEKPKEKLIIKNFPNPATNKTQITFNIKKSCELSLSVFDALGKLCETKNYGIIEYGETNILLDTENYPPGTYTCKIQCGGEVQNHSFVIVK